MILLVDAHAHLPADAGLANALSAAWDNFSDAEDRLGARADHRVLFLMEPAASARYAAWSNGVDTGEWSLRRGSEPHVFTGSGVDGKLVIVAGRQLVTEDGLEVHVIGTEQRFEERTPLERAIRDVRGSGGRVILPWGVGKWLGERGRKIAGALRADDSVLVSDNGGRPWFWPTPRLLAAGAGDALAGSDPLPVPGDERRLGSFGSLVMGDLAAARPFTDLLARLGGHGVRVRRYGKLATARRFLAHQLRMQLFRRRAERVARGEGT